MHEHRSYSINDQSNPIIDKNYYKEQLFHKEQQIQQLEQDKLDLQRRVRMLEYALRQERMHKTSRTARHHRVNSDIVGGLLSEDFQAKRNNVVIKEMDDQRTMKTQFIHKSSLSNEQPQVEPVKYEMQKEPMIRVWREADVNREDELRVNINEGRNINKNQWKPLATLRSHMDGVRDLFFMENSQVLVTASEDNMLKLWDLDNLGNDYEPYFTLRGHQKPVFTITGGYQSGSFQINNDLIYSGGLDGKLFIWKVPLPEFVDQYGTYDQRYSIGSWQAHEDAIWNLSHHPTRNLILSTSSDGTVKLWKILSMSQNLEIFSKGKQRKCLKIFSSQAPGNAGLDIPTTSTWLQSDPNSLIIGYTAPFISIFHPENPNYSVIPFNSESSLIEHQTNTITSSNSLCISGHEDKRIRIFDARQGVCIREIVGHTDAVTSVSVAPTGSYILSGGHDGSVRCWDLRNFQCAYEYSAHRKKFDEAVYAVGHHPSKSIMGSAGADCLVKLFESKVN